MKEKDIDNEFKRLKKGIENGWLFSDFDEEDEEVDKDNLQLNKESIFEKYKKDQRKKLTNSQF